MNHNQLQIMYKLHMDLYNFDMILLQHLLHINQLSMNMYEYSNLQYMLQHMLNNNLLLFNMQHMEIHIKCISNLQYPLYNLIDNYIETVFIQQYQHNYYNYFRSMNNLHMVLCMDYMSQHLTNSHHYIKYIQLQNYTPYNYLDILHIKMLMHSL
ncbi:unnamed protein product [Paramecium primaurelia]|uniref:Uncharacterized protein n=1 Tax=Paramecium primaurelia TaxID=5886 RepID=A0A8S1PPA7_PARPR|nr:unnamed protein product [Paramecium primaurelia]